LTAFRQLIPRLITIAALAAVFMALTVVISLGWLNTPDHDVQQLMAGAWRESLHPLFRGIAELGGLELTTLLMIGLVVFLIRRGFPSDAWVFAAFVVAQAFEVFYKFELYHPSPSAAIAHADGPSVTDAFSGVTGAHNSFPSGHMVRTVLVYGLFAFVLRRLAPWPWARALALPAAVVIIVLVAFDRLYLSVHWESDVIGGILLGALGMVAATVWLDRPRDAQN
jgi:membrane-associated phospholipid phosphatase